MKIENNSKIYNKTNTMVYSCQYHIIFTTKYRRNVLSEKVSSRLKEIIIENQAVYNYKVIELEIMPDHVHLLLDIDPYIGVYSVVGKIKGLSSNILRKEFKEIKSRIPTLWTRSKFISSVGSVSLDVVKKYIEEQKKK